MQIISRGRLPQGSVFQTTCKNCGTLFSFFRSEAEYVPNDQKGDYLSIMCPLEGCLHVADVPIAQHNFGR